MNRFKEKGVHLTLENTEGDKVRVGSEPDSIELGTSEVLI